MLQRTSTVLTHQTINGLNKMPFYLVHSWHSQEKILTSGNTSLVGRNKALVDPFI